ncbi:MAG: IS4/IS5 family transposase [ANME-2 cluster archaeon]|nr:MAG: IS4/IS5 family transposase [ANME-2 cluster archaeon]
MQPPLIPTKRDYKWELLLKILNVFDLRSSKQILAKNGIKSIETAVPILKILIVSMFFSSDISYVVNELSQKKKLQKFMKITSIPTENQIYRFMNRFEPEKFTNFVISLLNNVCFSKKRGRKTIIIDSTDIDLDINWFTKKITKKQLEERDFKWGYSPHRGYFIGMKLTLALDYSTLKPLGFLINEANVSESKIFPKILNELKRRRILKPGDTVCFDKGYYSYENYVLRIAKYKIIPVIFPRKNCDYSRLFDMLSYPLVIFDSKKDTEIEKRIYEKLVSKFKSLIKSWRELRPIKSMIEDVFKLAKNSYSMAKLHRYTMSSVKKHCSLNVLLIGMTISAGIQDKKALQRLSEQ